MSGHSAPQVAVVTGGASGIGLETSLLLASRGYTVAIGDIDLEGATSTAKTISAAGVKNVLAGYKAPRRIVPTAAFPRGPKGKLDLTALRAIAAVATEPDAVRVGAIG